jgi:hypothetical protein
MRRNHWLAGVAGAIALGMLPLSAQAAPLAGAANTMQADAGGNALVQQARWDRHCWWRRGHRHCRRVWRRWGYHPYYRDRYGYYHRHHHHGGVGVHLPGFSFHVGPGPHYW